MHHPQAFINLGLTNNWFNLNGRDYFCLGHEIKNNGTLIVQTDSRKFVWKYMSEYENIKIITDKPTPKKYVVQIRPMHRIKSIPEPKKTAEEKFCIKTHKKKEKLLYETVIGACNVYRCKLSGMFVSGIIHTSGSYEFGSFNDKTSAYRVFVHARDVIIKSDGSYESILNSMSKIRMQMMGSSALKDELTKPKPYGVDYMEKVHKWRANIRVDGKPIHISLEDTEEMCIKAHSDYVKKNGLVLKSENSYYSKKHKK